MSGLLKYILCILRKVPQVRIIIIMYFKRWIFHFLSLRQICVSGNTKRSTSGWSFRSFLRTFRFFPSIVTSTLQALLGTWSARRKRGKKKKKVYKIFKSTKTSPIACGNKFPLTFYFRFVRNGWRMERYTNDGGEGKKTAKKDRKT